MSILIFITGNLYTYLLPILLQNKNQLSIVVEKIYGLNSYQYFQKQSLKFLGRSLVTKRLGFIQIPEVRMKSKTCRFQ